MQNLDINHYIYGEDEIDTTINTREYLLGYYGFDINNVEINDRERRLLNIFVQDGASAALMDYIGRIQRHNITGEETEDV